MENTQNRISHDARGAARRRFADSGDRDDFVFFSLPKVMLSSCSCNVFSRPRVLFREGLVSVREHHALGSTVVSGSVLTGSRHSSFFNSHTTLKSVELGFLPIPMAFEWTKSFKLKSNVSAI